MKISSITNKYLCKSLNSNLLIVSQRFVSLTFRTSSANASVKKFESIPGPKPSLPLIGTGWQYFKYIGRYDLSHLHEANEDKYRLYGSIVKEEYQWRKPIIHIFDPKDFETVFRNQGKCPIRPPNEFVQHYRRRNCDKYPNVGLANMTGEDWYKQRLLLAPALMKLKVVQNHIPSQNKICDDFVNYIWETRDSKSDILIDLQDATYRFALESICMMCLDERMQCLSTNNTLTSDGSLLISATKRLFESYNELYYGIPVWKLFPTNSYRKLDEAESCIYNIASKYVQIAFNTIKLNNRLTHSISNEVEQHKHESVLQTLIKTEGLTEKDVKITIIDFIAGGIFTVSNTLSFLFYHLATNTEVQQKLFNEINAVMGDNTQLTANMLTKLPYLKACVRECFRLSCPVPGIMRILPQPITLSGYNIPAGTIIFSHFMVTSRLSEYFDEPHIYRPERWIGDAKKKLHPFSLLPFGYGNRMCAGRRFSELELYLATVKLIKHFELRAVTTKLDLKHAFIVIPAHPISLKLKLRKPLNKN